MPLKLFKRARHKLALPRHGCQAENYEALRARQSRNRPTHCRRTGSQATGRVILMDRPRS